jgi:hypothetical protein
VSEQTQDLPASGMRFGPFRLGQPGASRVGRRVWLAWQDQPERAVVLETLDGTAPPPAGLARFRYQVKSLSLLEHPGLLRVHEGGIHVDEDDEELREIPWIASEHADGSRPIKAHVEALRPARADLLRLLRPLCDAVQYVHQKSVPGLEIDLDSVIVDGKGRARLTGVALCAPVWRTLAGEPDEPVSPREDVLALGRLLDALLPADRPADLRAIVTTATAEAPEQRYPSPAALSADIERFLDDRPVEAHGFDPLYPARMFVKRHRYVSGAIAAVIAFTGMLALAGGIVAWRGYVGEQRALERARGAEAERDALRLVEDARAAEAAGDAGEARRLWADAVARLEALATAPPGDGRTRRLLGEARAALDRLPK